MRYWLSRGEGEVIGPFTIAELEAMAARGELVGASGVMPQVCPEGETVWRPVSMLPDLAELTARLMGGRESGASTPSAARAPLGAAAPALWPAPQVPGADPLSGIGFSFNAAFEVGWRIFRASYPLLLGVTALTFGLSMAGSLSLMWIDALAARAGGNAAIALHLLSLLMNLSMTCFVNVPLTVGAIWLVVPMVRGGPGQFADLLTPYRRLLHLLATAILVGLLLLAAALLGVIVLVGGAVWAGQSNGAAGAVTMVVVGALAILVPTMIIGARLSPAYLLVLDPQAGPQGPLGPVQAIVSAWQITSGRVWPIIGLGLVVSLIAVVTIMACFLPWIFFGNPLNVAVYGAAYALLVHRGAGSTPGMSSTR